MDRIEAIDPPPYGITPTILACIEKIGEAIGSAEATGAARDLTLRRINRIRTIRGSLALPFRARGGDGRGRSRAYRSTRPAGTSTHGQPAGLGRNDERASPGGTSFIEFMLGMILEAARSVSSSDQVSDQVALLLASLRTSPKAASALMAEMGLSHRPSFRKNYLGPAMSSGLVEMTRPDAPRAKNQKYRLTRRGRDALLRISGSI